MTLNAQAQGIGNMWTEGIEMPKKCGYNLLMAPVKKGIDFGERRSRG